MTCRFACPAARTHPTYPYQLNTILCTLAPARRRERGRKGARGHGGKGARGQGAKQRVGVVVLAHPTEARWRGQRKRKAPREQQGAGARARNAYQSARRVSAGCAEAARAEAARAEAARAEAARAGAARAAAQGAPAAYAPCNRWFAYSGPPTPCPAALRRCGPGPSPSASCSCRRQRQGGLPSRRPNKVDAQAAPALSVALMHTRGTCAAPAKPAPRRL